MFKRYGFAVIVAGALAAMMLGFAGKSIFAGASTPSPGSPREGAGAAVEVTVIAAATHLFTDGVQALGTAQARESIIITPKAADTIRAIRFDSGDRVRRGQVLVEMSSTEQSASAAEARASHDAAQEELRRFQELYERGFASQARIDAVRASANSAAARLNALDSRMADRTLRAPFDGIVGLRNASPGQYVQPGAQIGTLDDVSQIKLDFDVPETQFARLREGVAIIARTAAFADRTFEGVVDHVDTRINQATRTVRVRALMPNPDEALRPGMLMTVEIRSNPREALSVPEISLLEEAGGSYLYRAVPSGEGHLVERVSVTTGQRAGGMAEILSGVTRGDLVVTEGVQSVRPGQAIRLNSAGRDQPTLRNARTPG
ncbi:MAG TPA: efflux RND transporter periplasmic adaptor subunit [Terricaulis sp.]|nr:efflux RND transporter periplasmic adaptor subunit [Terricaulis sp.]